MRLIRCQLSYHPQWYVTLESKVKEEYTVMYSWYALDIIKAASFHLRVCLVIWYSILTTRAVSDLFHNTPRLHRTLCRHVVYMMNLHAAEPADLRLESG